MLSLAFSGADVSTADIGVLSLHTNLFLFVSLFLFANFSVFRLVVPNSISGADVPAAQRGTILHCLLHVHLSHISQVKISKGRDLKLDLL